MSEAGLERKMLRSILDILGLWFLLVRHWCGAVNISGLAKKEIWEQKQHLLKWTLLRKSTVLIMGIWATYVNISQQSGLSGSASLLAYGRKDCCCSLESPSHTPFQLLVTVKGGWLLLTSDSKTCNSRPVENTKNNETVSPQLLSLPNSTFRTNL